MKTILELNPTIKELLNLSHSYQPNLTMKLDNTDSDFDQELINEIVLWKINRYTQVNVETLNLINEIESSAEEIDPNLTTTILKKLLQIHGIRLPMASTILRLRNSRIYQIIDQRTYRIIYGANLKLKLGAKESVKQYLDYLIELRRICKIYQIQFSQSDRVLYEYDKLQNTEVLKY